MADVVVDPLILDLLVWLASADRTYEEVICPRLPVWEEANDRGLVVRENVNGLCLLRITSSGRNLLAQRDKEKQHE